VRDLHVVVVDDGRQHIGGRAVGAEQDHIVHLGVFDPDLALMPAGTSVLEFNKAIIDATSDLVCAYKPQFAFYEAMGQEGMEASQKMGPLTEAAYQRALADSKRISRAAIDGAFRRIVGRFPKQEAASIAFKTVSGCLEQMPDIERVVFCCFSGEDRNLYQQLLDGKE